MRTAVSPSDAGQYSVVVSNAFGSVTSTAVTVTVNPAGPNPSFGGTRFVAVLDRTSVVPGSLERFDTETLSETSARWMRDQIVIIGQNSSGEPLGIFSWQNGSLLRLLQPDVQLGDTLGQANGFTLVPALPNDRLVLRGQQMIEGFRQPIGMYALEGSILSTIADTTLAVPGAGGAKFPIFYWDAFEAGGKTVFASTLEGVPSLYLAEGGTVHRIVHGRQELPVTGAGTTQFQSLAFNGHDIFVVSATSAQEKLVALKIDPQGDVVKLLAKDEPLPGSNASVRSFGTAGTDGSAFYLVAYDNAFQQNILSWKDGAFTRLAGPGMQVGELGTVQSIESSYPKAVDGKVYASMRVLTPQGSTRCIAAAGSDSIEPVFSASKMDGKRIGATYVVDVAAGKLILLVHFVNGERALYANLQTEAQATLRLDFTRRNLSTLQFTIPNGVELQGAPTLLGPWLPLTTGDVTIRGGNRFFRLRNP